MSEVTLSDGRVVKVGSLKMKAIIDGEKFYKDNQTQKEVYWVSQATGLSMEDIEEMDFKDYILISHNLLNDVK